MKQNILSLLIGGLIVFILMRSCKQETKFTKPITGNFKTDTIQHTDTIIIKDVKIKNVVQEVEKLKIMYETETFEVKDSICKDLMTLRNFESRFEDDNIIGVVGGTVQGYVKTIDFDYLIKPQPVMEKPNEKKFSLSGGLGSDFNATTPVIKIGVGYKNCEFDYLRINNQQFITATYRIRF